MGAKLDPPSGHIHWLMKLVNPENKLAPGHDKIQELKEGEEGGSRCFFPLCVGLLHCFYWEMGFSPV